MGEVIPFSPRNADRAGLLRVARERAGLGHAELARLVGPAIGRPQLSGATVRAWELGTVPPPTEVLEAAQRVARAESPVSDNAIPLLDARLGPDGHVNIEAAVQSLREADRKFGGGYTYGAVIRYLERGVAPQLLNSNHDMFEAAAALTEMAGWMAHDAGHDELAERHVSRALRFATVTENVELRAHVHASLSHLAQHLHRPRDALRRAQAGSTLLGRHPHHPALAARLYAMQARALASLRRRADCERALRKAETALHETSECPPSPWVSPFDRASLAAEGCQAAESLGNLGAARRNAEVVVQLRDGDHLRSRTFGQLRLATILAAQGEIDYACAVAEDALETSGGVSSARVGQLIRAVHAALTPHTSTPRVEHVVASFATALRTRPAPLRLAAAARNLEP